MEFYHRISIFFLYLLEKVQHNFVQEGRDYLKLKVTHGISYNQFMYSLIFVFTEFCHIDINISRRLSLETYLRDVISSETDLYTASEWSDNYVNHAIEIALFGLFLFRLHLSEECTLLDYITRLAQSDQKNLSDNIIKNWIVAALLHRIGATLEIGQGGLQKIKKLKKLLEIHRMRLSALEVLRSGYGINVPLDVINQVQVEWEEIRRLETQIETQLHYWSAGKMPAIEVENNQEQGIIGDDRSSKEIENLQGLLEIHHRNLIKLEEQKAYYGIIQAPLSLMHGIEHEQSQIHQLEVKLRAQVDYLTTREAEKEMKNMEDGAPSYLNVRVLLKMLSDDIEALVKDFEPAIVAIKKHNEKEETVAFSKEPLAFFLVLCEEILMRGGGKIGMQSFSETIISSLSLVSHINRPLNYLFAAINLDKNKAWTIPNNALDFCLFFHNASGRHFQPLAVWLSKTYNLQRLRISEDELKMSVILSNPVSHDLRSIDDPNICEFGMLREFMREHRAWRELKDWIENKDTVKWEFEKDQRAGNRIEVENIILFLNKFTDMRLLRKDPIEIFDELFEWRRKHITRK